jgi:hypothetical protein
MLPKRYCLCCGRQIPPEKVAKSGHSKPPLFYNRDHFVAWRKARGFYFRFGGLGLDAQRKIKRETGHAPGYENRCAALSRVRWKGGRKKKNG